MTPACSRACSATTTSRAGARPRPSPPRCARTAPAWLVDLVATYDHLFVTFDPGRSDHAGGRGAARRAARVAGRGRSPTSRRDAPSGCPSCSGATPGPTSSAVAEELDLSARRARRAADRRALAGAVRGLARRHAVHRPGRLGRQRAADEGAARRRAPGSIALSGSQSIIYPVKSPGGWRLVGRTPLAAGRPHGRRSSSPTAPVTCSTTCRSTRTASPSSRRRATGWRRSRERTTTTAAAITVESAGLAVVQDLGRPGHGDKGISANGASDRGSAQMANVLVGNAPGDSPAGDGRLVHVADASTRTRWSPSPAPPPEPTVAGATRADLGPVRRRGRRHPRPADPRAGAGAPTSPWRAGSLATASSAASPRTRCWRWVGGSAAATGSS